jgi:DNA polymerase (family 10)
LRALGEYKKGAGKTTRMVLPYAAELAEKVLVYLKQSKDISQAQPLGSLRRMKETVGDVDIAISTKDPKAAIEHFSRYPLIDRLIEKGPVSISALVSGGKQVDIIALPPESFGSLLQHFTGIKYIARAGYKRPLTFRTRYQATKKRKRSTRNLF